MKKSASPSDRILERLRQRRWDTTSEGAKYQKLQEALAEAITKEGCPAGTRIPTETELVSVTPFSLGTVQRALRSLVDEKVIERRHGSGSVVAQRTLEISDPIQCRFIGDDGISVFPVYPEFLERVRIAEKGPWSSFLDQGRDNVLRVDRLIRIGDEFTTFARLYVRADRYPALEKVSAEALHGANFTRLIAGQTDPRSLQLVRTVVSGPLPAMVCRAIGVAPGSPGMTLHVQVQSGGKPLYFQTLYIPPTTRLLQI